MTLLEQVTTRGLVLRVQQGSKSEPLVRLGEDGAVVVQPALLNRPLAVQYDTVARLFIDHAGQAVPAPAPAEQVAAVEEEPAPARRPRGRRLRLG
jgi:hypothetical protein